MIFFSYSFIIAAEIKETPENKKLYLYNWKGSGQVLYKAGKASLAFNLNANNM